MKKALSILLVALLVFGCTAALAGDTKVITVGFSWDQKNASLYDAMDAYTLKACEEKFGPEGYTVEFKHAVCEGDVNKQAADIEDLLSSGIDVLMIYAKDATAIGASIELAASKGVPTICWDRDTAPGVTPANAWIGMDTVHQGYSTGVALFTAMKEAGIKPIVLNVMGATTDNNAINRDTGVKKAGAELGAEFVQDIPSDWNVEKAMSGLAAALQAHPEANTIFCASDYIWPGMQVAIENADRWYPAGDERHMWVGSQDVYSVAIPLLREGYMDFNTAFDIWAMSVKAADVIYDMVINGVKFDGEKFAVEGAVASTANVDSLEGLWSRDFTD